VEIFLIYAAVMSAVGGSQTRLTQENDWRRAVIETEDSTPAPRRKGKTEALSSSLLGLISF